MLAPPGELVAPPPRVNPGSATDHHHSTKLNPNYSTHIKYDTTINGSHSNIYTPLLSINIYLFTT